MAEETAHPDGLVVTYEARPRSITAAAKRIDPSNKADLAWVPKKSEGWQNEAWTYVDAVPELKFAVGFNGNALSRLRLYPAYIVDRDQAPVPIQDAVGSAGCTQKLANDAQDESSRMDQSEGGLAGLMNEYGKILSVSGDSYTVATPETPTEDEQWSVYSESAMKKSDKGLALRMTPNGKPEPLPEGSFIARVWRRHSRWPGLADSNMRAVLSESEELLIASRQFRAVMKSRNNAGILFLSNKLDVVNPNAKPGELTTLEAGLFASMITPTHDDSSASSVMPHVVRGDGKPDELIKHFPLDRKIDESAIARVTFLIQRLAHGLDTPVEVLTGVADVNHWSAWQIEDQSYKMHLEPLAQVPAGGLAKAFLRPALILRGNDPDAVHRVVYAIDSAALVVRPNRSADAKDAFDRLAISWDALRQYLGFSEGDKPTDEEMAQRAIMGLGLFKRSGLAQPGEDLPGLPSGGGDATSGGDGEAARRFAIAVALGLMPTREAIAAPITAASRPAPKPSDVGRILTEIEIRVRERVQSIASETMRSALRVAGVRLKNAAQGNSVLKAQVNRVNPVDVARTLGHEQAITAAGGDMGSLLDGSFDDVGHEFDVLTRAAQDRVIAQIRENAPDEETADVAVERFQRNQDENRATARDALVAGLVALGSRRLFAPDAAAEPGEFDERMSVPAGLVRSALAIAGGSSAPSSSPTDAMGSSDWGIGGGIALGPDAQEAMSTIGLEYESMVWTVGWPSRPFEPHSDLDGLVFTDWTDEALAFDDWPASDNGGFLFPGDHDGCQCVGMPIYLDGSSSGEADPGGE